MSKTILIIDDDDLIRALLVRAIERAGFVAVAAGAGPPGIDLFRSSNPDLVVLDIAMPEMTGFEVAATIRTIEAHENRPHTPIIVLTAYARSFLLPLGTQAGIDSYLMKPVTPEQLVKHVTEFLSEPPPSPPDSA
jgi:CheY-like chemotaxis protein